MNPIFRMTLAGALLIVVIILIRALVMHKLPKQSFLILWGVALFQLLIPFSVPSQISILNLIPSRDEVPPAIARVQAAPEVLSDFLSQNQEMLSGMSSAGSIAESGEPSLLGGIEPLVLVYFTGVALLAIFFTILYTKNRKGFRESLPISNDYITDWLRAHPLIRTFSIRVSDKIAAPLTYGILRPVILLPKNIDWRNERKLDFILAHEFVHIKRFDALTKLVMAATVCIHWFNPIVWGMYVLFNRDLEISCDESVLHMLGEDSKKNYALTLIGMMERPGHLPALYSNFSKYAIEERISAIMKMKNRTIIGTAMAVLMVATVVTVFATAPSVEAAEGVEISISQEESQALLEELQAVQEELEEVRAVLIEGITFGPALENISFTYEDIYDGSELLGEHQISLDTAMEQVAAAIEEQYGFSIDGMTGYMSFIDNPNVGLKFWSGFVVSEELTTHSDGNELFHFQVDGTTGEVRDLSKNTVETPFLG